MQNAKNLCAALTLVFAFAVVTPADETNAPTCVPGDISTPPCHSMIAGGDLTGPGETLTPAAQDSIGILSLAAQAALDLLLF